MNGISKELIENQKEKLHQLSGQLRDEGADDQEIISAIKKHFDIKRKQFSQKYKVQSFLQIIKNLNLDSKKEGLFFEAMKQSGMRFQVQVEIGRYRVDFLIEENIIFEGDGPQHGGTFEYDQRRDAYLESLGYRVIRVPWWAVELDPEAIIDEIRQTVNSP